ncbi:MAG: hypothetical protein AAGD04_07640 [Pseudomonadota bacterium]
MFQKSLIALAALTAFAAPAQSAVLKFTATANFPWQSSDFSILFDDQDGDGKLSADEVVSFSGFTNIQLGQSYSELLRVSPVPTETDEPQTFTSGGFPINTWLFGEGPSQRTAPQPSSFSYAVTSVALPASGGSLLLALGLFSLARRRA